MRAICLALFTTSLAAGSVLAQLSDAPAALYAGADIVFDGRLEKIAPTGSGLTARFSVTQLIKGQAETTKGIQVQIPAESRCHAFEEDHRYLVYGRKIDEQLWVDPCEGSKLYSQAEADLRYIHTMNPKVLEQCNRIRLKQLAKTSAIVAKAKVVGTEDSMGGPELLFRPWCGTVFMTEYAYYDVLEVMKGEIPDSKIAVEHVICWDTITVDGYSPSLSSELFREGNVLLLFLKRGSHRIDQVQTPFKSGYEDVDENCGAVIADGDAAQGVVEALHGAR
jgi:hypothetical protein